MEVLADFPHCGQKKHSFKKTLLTVLRYIALLVQRVQNLHLLDRLPKITSSSNHLNSGKLEYSELVNQLYTLMLLINVAYMLRH